MKMDTRNLFKTRKFFNELAHLLAEYMIRSHGNTNYKQNESTHELEHIKVLVMNYKHIKELLEKEMIVTMNKNKW